MLSKFNVSNKNCSNINKKLAGLLVFFMSEGK